MVKGMAKRTSVDLSDADEEAIQVVMRRYGQQSEAGVIRLCLHMVAQAEKIELKSPVRHLPLPRSHGSDPQPC